jgi:predicted nucleic acid-binding protein
MIVVSDTSPINYLTLIGHEDLLQSLFGEIIVPTSVFDELSHPGAPMQIQHLLSARPAWLQIVEPTPGSGSEFGHLDRGERDAILLGIGMRADFVLMDEARGRETAQALGLSVIGTVGVLERAIRKGLVDGPEVTAKLRATSFRATPKLLAFLAGLTRERLSG